MLVMIRYFLDQIQNKKKKSYLNSLSELPTEVEDKPPPVGYELGKLKEKNLMQRDEHSSEFWTHFQHDEAKMTGHDMLYNLCPYHMSFQPSYIPSIAHHGSGFVENSKVDLYAENEFCVVDSWHKKNGPRCQLLEE